MRELKWKLHQYSFKPADYNVDEVGDNVRKIMDVHRGTWVKGVAVRIGQVFNGTIELNNPGITVGAGAGAGGFVKGDDLTHPGYMAVLGLYPGHGDYLNRSIMNGMLFTEDDTIDLYFTAADSGSPTQGLATIYIVYCETE